MSGIWEKAVSLGIENQDDATIAETLSAVTQGPLAVDEVLFFLASNGLFEKDAIDGSVTGSLAAIIQDEQSDQGLRDGLREFINHLHRTGSKTVATNRPEWALKASGLLSVLLAASVITQQQVDDFYQLDGGLVFPSGVAEQQVADARAAETFAVQVQSLESSFVTRYWNPILDGIQNGTYTTEADIDAAVTSIAGG